MLDTIFQIWDAISPVVVPSLAGVGLATGFSIFTPNSHSNKILHIILQVLNAISGNILRNKNRDS